MENKLIISIVPRNFGEVVVQAAAKANCSGGTILMGSGTASSNVLQLLGLGQSDKDITLNIVNKDIVLQVIDSIKNEMKNHRNCKGILFCLNANTFIKAGTPEVQNNSGDKKAMFVNEYEMINIIVNKGYAEDAMAAARKAGAGGGTIMSARGTAKEGDEKFFGMEIVPEKDMLMIVVPIMKKEAVINAIKQLDCFSKAGSGIIFSCKAEYFTTLGESK